MEDNDKAPTQFTFEVPSVAFKLDASDIASSLPPSQIVRLIKELDLEANEWEVTLLLYHHFLLLHESS